MKICLINPKYGCGQKAHRIPLGLAYIAAVLKKKSYDVEGYNLDVDPEPRFIKYDVIGIYLSTPMIKHARELIKRAEKAMAQKGGKLILGGPHISADPNFAKQFNAIGIPGEGEYTFLDIIKYGKIKKRKPSNLDEFPFPAKEVFDHGNYKNKAFAYGAIIASRGCPFKCKNCQPGLSKISPYRVRDPNQVVWEMLTLWKKYNVKDFSFEDSELIISKKWTLKLCNEIIENFNENGINITFQGNARLHQLDDKVLSKLRRAGCRRLGVGLESGSQHVLDKHLNKAINLKEDLPNLNKIKKQGIESHVWIMIGIPGETKKDIKKTIEITKNLNVSTIELNIATPWPGTYFYDEAKKKGWLTKTSSEEFDEKRKSFFNTPHLSTKRVEELFEIFKKELEKCGWIKWSHETNTYIKKPALKDITKVAWKKILRGEIFMSDLKTLKKVIENRLKT